MMSQVESVSPPLMDWKVQNLYDRMILAGSLYRLCARLSHRPVCLLALDTVTASFSVTNRHDANLQTVAIRQIRGSENRTEEFDARFCPLNNHTYSRWQSIARAQMGGANMPPVELIQIGDIYFVRDGHHRISVARAMGQTHIDAVVTVWEMVDRSVARIA
jgi:hypothetical protein